MPPIFAVFSLFLFYHLLSFLGFITLSFLTILFVPFSLLVSYYRLAMCPPFIYGYFPIL